jgi:hypothetical protein
MLERRAMLGAGSLLPPGKVVKAGQLWVGRPARYVRDLTSEEIEANLQAVVQYAKLADEYRPPSWRESAAALSSSRSAERPRSPWDDVAHPPTNAMSAAAGMTRIDLFMHRLRPCGLKMMNIKRAVFVRVPQHARKSRRGSGCQTTVT